MSTKFISGRVLEGRLGRYRILNLAHEGGMGIIYWARRVSDGLDVAIKVPAVKGDGHDGERFRRLRREMRILKDLSHKNIVKYIDEGVNMDFLVMEYLNGGSLKDIVKSLDRETALKIFREIVDAIGYMHSKGYVHGDIKPSNIIIVDGRPVLIDFGTARNIVSSRLTLFECNALTPEWAAPEQFEKQMFKETDVYQLGLLLIYLLTGKSPKKYMVDGKPILSQELDKRIKDFIYRCLEKVPGERYRDGFEALKALYLKAYLIREDEKHIVSDYYTIGRGDGNSLKINDPYRYVHRYHCLIYYNAYAASYYIRPLEEKWRHKYNYPHVYRDGRYIKINDAFRLEDGDRIALCYNVRRGPYIEYIFKTF